MTPTLRVVLIVVSILTTFMIMRKIRQSKLQIEDSIFWLGFSSILIVFSIFPGLPDLLAELAGTYTTANFIYLAVIFLLIVKMFHMSIKQSQLATKIKDLAQKGSCVIIGRCADYILKDDPDAYHIFVCGNESEKIARTQKLFDLSEKEARNMNQDMDKKRRLHYEYYTDRKWGDFKNHCMILNTSVLGLERCIQYIVELLQSDNQ